MASISELISAAMRKIGVLAAGEALPAAEGKDALFGLNQMLDAWSNESLLIPIITHLSFPLHAGQQLYTIGILSVDEKVDYNSCQKEKKSPGNHFQTDDQKEKKLPENHFQVARPEKILSAFLRDEYGTDYILEPIDVQTFSRISVKYVLSRPTHFYVRKGFPCNEILFQGVPYHRDEFHLEVIQPFSEILKNTRLTDEIKLPPGYERALIYNLCVELADEWGKQVSQTVYNVAAESKLRIKRANYRDITLFCDTGIIQNRHNFKGDFDINGGSW